MCPFHSESYDCYSLNSIHEIFKARFFEAEVGLDSVRALDKFMGCANKVFRDVLEGIILFVGELRRWKGEHMLYRAYFERTEHILATKCLLHKLSFSHPDQVITT